jgi:pyruvate/2-oxoglutarate dehydrogenase complex dihydrolipoamide acyltransferase (E2) component
MIKVLVPRENVNDGSVIVRAIHVDSGRSVTKGQLIVEIETSKTNIDIEAPENGVLSHALKLDAEIEVGATLFCIVDKSDSIAPLEKEHPQVEDVNIKISKAAVRRAGELNIDPKKIGFKWVTKEHVEKQAGVASKQLATFRARDDQDNNEIMLNSPVKKEPLSKRKRAEIKNLQIGGHHSTSSTIGINIKVLGNRVVAPPYLFQNNISDLIVFEASRLLRTYAELNSVYIDSKTYGKYDEINFGWSFDDGANLKVLAIKNADQLSLSGVQKEVEKLLELYESNQPIPIDLLNSSTVTISDLSKTDASFILPLINGFQSLIIGVVKRNESDFELYATFDHRVSEGLRVTEFLTELKRRILSYYLDQDGITNLTCHACEKTMAEEISLRHRGFIKITLPNGKNANLCRNCFEGW